MYLYYIRLQHVVKAQTGSTPWIQSPTPIFFNYMSEVENEDKALTLLRCVQNDPLINIKRATLIN